MKIITALILSLCGFATTAQAAPSYRCDAQVTNMITRQKGSFIMDAGTLERVDNAWAVTLITANGPQTSYFGDKSNAPTYEGFPESGVHFVDHVDAKGNGSNTDYDLIPNDEFTKIALYVTPRDDSGNQMVLKCDILR